MKNKIFIFIVFTCIFGSYMFENLKYNFSLSIIPGWSISINYFYIFLIASSLIYIILYVNKKKQM